MTRVFSIQAAALALAVLPLSGAAAQVADPAMLSAERDAIATFGWMDGMWRGTAVTRGPGGEHKLMQTERIGSMLDGTIKVIEGKGFNTDGSVGFNAFAVISFDPASKAYTFRSYAQGRVGTFTITPRRDGAGTGYVWEIPAPGATIRYTATFDKGVWREIGERIVPGQPAQQFFEMNLTRVGDSTWPATGGLGPK